MRKTPSMKLVEARTGRELGDVLRDLLVAKRHSRQEIAEALEVSHTTVANWLEAYGISEADRPRLVIEGRVQAATA